MAKNFSSRRKAVLDVLKSTKEHPSADVVFERCREIVPTISLGTVYRNLSELQSSGEIISVGTVQGRERYDGNPVPHVHVICGKCGKVWDEEISNELEKSITEEMLQKNYSSYQLNFESVCTECKQQQN